MDAMEIDVAELWQKCVSASAGFEERNRNGPWVRRPPYVVRHHQWLSAHVVNHVLATSFPYLVSTSYVPPRKLATARSGKRVRVR